MTNLKPGDICEATIKVEVRIVNMRSYKGHCLCLYNGVFHAFKTKDLKKIKTKKAKGFKK